MKQVPVRIGDGYRQHVDMATPSATYPEQTPSAHYPQPVYEEPEKRMTFA